MDDCCCWRNHGKIVTFVIACPQHGAPALAEQYRLEGRRFGVDGRQRELTAEEQRSLVQQAVTEIVGALVAF